MFYITDIAGILGHTDTKIISDTNLAALVRQIAIHCNVSNTPGLPFTVM